MNKLLVPVIFALLVSTSAFAGGSSQTVDLVHIAFLGDEEFVLTVRPRPDLDGYEENYFEDCETFVVIGEYHPSSIFKSGYMPSLKEHKAALRFLKSKPKRFSLGYIGGGFFQPDKNNKCVVQSRALNLTDGNSVYSWYSSI
jgi:hypothetical protein